MFRKVIEDRIIEEFEKRKDYELLTFDELFNEIIYNADDPDVLSLIAEAIRFNDNLSDFEKEELWDLIDRRKFT